MVRARHFAAAGTASLLIAGAFFASLFSSADAWAENSAGCDDAELAVLTAPLAPWKGAPLRVIFTAEKPQDGELALIAPDGSVAARSRERHGGPPYFWSAEVASPVAGMWHARLTRDRGQSACGTLTRDIAVGDTVPPRPRASAGSVWPVRGE